MLGLDVVVPVYNEEGSLERSVRVLHSTLRSQFTIDWRITIADNASTDRTAEIARRLSAEFPEVELLHLAEKGRGRALKKAWLESPAEVVAYVDVDLSTDLRALPPLIAPLLSGHSDVAIGSRLRSGSRVVRGAKREFVSRTYNLLLRRTMNVHFSDAQCGFKAMRRDAAHAILPHVQDTGWFFDTELLIVAERSGLRIHEVPVDWIDDEDSKVDVVATAMDDLRGLVRVTRSIVAGRIPLEQIYGPVEVLKGVNLRAYAGKVTALVGDNGAGKSTLVKGLAGVQPYDSGEVRFAGEIVHLHTPREAAALGIEVVYQDLALCENLDIVQNMFLGREETSAGTLDEGVMERQASETLQSLSVRTVKSVRQKVSSLSGGQRQTVAIARSVLKNAKVVILDEPTAALGVAQTEQVLHLVRRLADSGVAVIIISHNLADVFAVADYISVLYLGQMVADLETENTNNDDVVGYITGSKTYEGTLA